MEPASEDRNVRTTASVSVKPLSSRPSTALRCLCTAAMQHRISFDILKPKLHLFDLPRLCCGFAVGLQLVVGFVECCELAADLL